MLRKALNDAVRGGLLERNVALIADPPPMRAVRAARRRSMRTWTETELRTFLASTEDHELHAMWVIAAFAGLRRSEVLGLRWSDVDLDGAVLAVSATVLPGADGYQLVEGPEECRVGPHDPPGSPQRCHPPKAATGGRRRAGHRERGMAGPRPGVPACGRLLVEPARDHARVRESRQGGRRAHIRLHDLRHTHATLLLRSGVNPKVVSERLGHSSVAFTLDTYAHVMPGMQPEAVELFRGLVMPHDESDGQGTT